MKRMLLNLVSVTIIGLSIWAYTHIGKVDIDLDNSQMYYLKSISHGIVTRVDSENIIKCDLSAVSNSINTLLADGFVIDKSDYKRDYMDLILIKDNEVYRIHYTKDGIFTSIAKPYKNSTIPITYINEKKE